MYGIIYIYMKYGMMNDFVCGSAIDTNIPYIYPQEYVGIAAVRIRIMLSKVGTVYIIMIGTS